MTPNRIFRRFRPSRLEAEELREITALWEEKILQLPEPSNLTSAAAQNLLLQGTRGYIGVLDQLLCEAAIRSLQLGRTHIDINTLRYVVKECALIA